MNIRRPLALAAAGIAFTLAAAACNNSNGETPLPEPTDAAPTEEAPTEEPTQDASPWVEDYTPRQVRGYDAALRRWTAYERLSEPIWSEGKATPEAEKLFKQFFPDPLWGVELHRLQNFEANDVQVVGKAEVLWSRPARISEGGTSVTIEQCIDQSGTVTYQEGVEVPNDWRKENPWMRSVELYKAEGYPWLISQVVYGTEEEREPCEP